MQHMAARTSQRKRWVRRKGDRCGWTAYSFRHETREKLAKAVGKYQAEYCFKPTVDANRTKDRELTIRLQGGSK